MSLLLRLSGLAMKYIMPISILATDFYNAGVTPKKQIGMTAMIVGAMLVLFILKDVKKYVEKSPKMWHTLLYTTFTRGIWLGLFYGIVSTIETHVASVGAVFLFLLFTQGVGGLLSTVGTYLKENKATTTT